MRTLHFIAREKAPRSIDLLTIAIGLQPDFATWCQLDDDRAASRSSMAQVATCVQIKSSMNDPIYL